MDNPKFVHDCGKQLNLVVNNGNSQLNYDITNNDVICKYTIENLIFYHFPK